MFDEQCYITVNYDNRIKNPSSEGEWVLSDFFGNFGDLRFLGDDFSTTKFGEIS